MEQKKDIQTLINLASALAQYSQIHTVTGVSYAGQPTHAQAIEQTQKWLYMNCDVVDGEYRLKDTPSPAKAEQPFNRDENSVEGKAAIEFYEWLQRSSMAKAEVPINIKWRMFVDQKNVKQKNNQ